MKMEEARIPIQKQPEEIPYAVSVNIPLQHPQIHQIRPDGNVMIQQMEAGKMDGDVILQQMAAAQM